MPKDPIYLDHNATTPIAPEVFRAMEPFLREHFGNPSSGHVFGRRARAAVDEAREQVAALIGARPEEIVFTGSGTEANHLALLGASEAVGRGRLAVSSIEHPSVMAPAERLERQGWTLDRLPVETDGRSRIPTWEQPLALVSVMLANNETGVVQPVAEIAEAARRVGGVVHTDAAQVAGRMPVDVRDLGVDLLTIVGHKMNAPKGIGALYVRGGVPLHPQLNGGGQERGLRGGTENVPYIVALGAACAMAARSLPDTTQHLAALRDRLWDQLQAKVPGLVLNGSREHRLPNTLNVSFPGVSGVRLLAAAPRVAASTGSACHADREEPSAVLGAMGLPAEQALGAVRLSVGRTTTEAEVDEAAGTLADAWRRLPQGPC